MLCPIASLIRTDTHRGLGEIETSNERKNGGILPPGRRREKNGRSRRPGAEVDDNNKNHNNNDDADDGRAWGEGDEEAAGEVGLALLSVLDDEGIGGGAASPSGGGRRLEERMFLEVRKAIGFPTIPEGRGRSILANPCLYFEVYIISNRPLRCSARDDSTKQ